jgi:hypothetical protein
MSVNRGVAPLDPASEVGQMRLLLGDTSYVPLAPPEVGFGNYKLFSDDEITTFLVTATSQEGAAALAYLQLAGAAAMESRSVKDVDLQVDLTKRANDLRQIAAMWQGRADAAAADVFELFDTVAPTTCTPELAPVACCGGGRCGVRLF